MAPDSSDRSGARIVRLFVIFNLALAACTAVGMVLLWPDGSSANKLEKLERRAQVQTELATVTAIKQVECEFGGTCYRVSTRVRSGEHKGETSTIQTGDLAQVSGLRVGDRVRLFDANAQDGGKGESPAFLLADFDRMIPIAMLTAIFVLVVLAFGGWHGLRALLGLVLSLVVLLVFLVPAVLDGRPPLAVAVVGSLAIMFVTISLAHGIGPKSVAAITGTSASLLLIVLLALIFTKLSHLSGFNEETMILRSSGFSLQGLVLAGMIIGAMGVLDDVTVSQSSTVMALRSANPAMAFRELFWHSVSVGRDHVAAAVNTLVLAYAGASLTVLIYIVVGDRNAVDALNHESVAKEVVGMLAGSIGLILAVPLTTAVAALLATRLPASRLEEFQLAHDHHH